ncbi:MAG: bifunctional oligoribonuclease/PAP phosphatase NrnA [bacterium]
MNKTVAATIQEALRQAQKILLVAHRNPDGDALGSILGLYGALVHQWHLTVELAIDGEIPQRLAYLPYFFKIQDGFRPEKFDTVVIMDCGGWKRTGFFDTNELNIAWPANLIVIDHHPVSGQTPGIHFLDARASSTSEVVWELIREWGVSITPEVATCLLTGIASDTGSFQHTNTTVQTLIAAADLLSRGANFPRVIEGVMTGKSPARLKLWGLVLRRMKYDAERNLAVSVVTQQDLRACGADTTDIEGLANLMSCLASARFALVIHEKPEGGLKGSFRTEQSNIDVKKLAEAMGGGGHVQAAGFEVSADLKIEKEGWRVV